MRVMLELGIYDDGDVLPTCVLMLADSDDVGTEELAAGVAELLEAGVKEYGRTPPSTALFWSCHPDPGAMLTSHRGGVDRSHGFDLGGES